MWINSKGFWRWCIALVTVMFLDCVHRIVFLKHNVSDTGCFSPQVKWWGHLLCWVRWLKLAVSNGPNRVGAPIILPEDGNIQFPKRYILETLDDGRSPETLFFQVDLRGLANDLFKWKQDPKHVLLTVHQHPKGVHSTSPKLQLHCYPRLLFADGSCTDVTPKCCCAAVSSSNVLRSVLVWCIPGPIIAQQSEPMDSIICKQWVPTVFVQSCGQTDGRTWPARKAFFAYARA
jgi:hypothetical protein